MENSKPYVVMVIVLLIFLIAMIGLFWFFTGRTPTSNNVKTENNAVTNIANGTETNSVSNNATNSTTTNTTNTVQNTTNSTGGGKTSTSGNITVTTPKSGDKVGKAVTITGFARVFENVVNMRIKDDAGNILATGFTTANSPDVGKTGPFSKSLTITNIPASKKGFVEVYDISPADGSVTDLVSTSVTFE